MSVRTSLLRVSLLIAVTLAVAIPQARSIAQTGSPGRVIVTPTSGLTTTERGGTATFTITLDRVTRSGVKIGLSCPDASEGTVSPTSVTFDGGDWMVPKTVTITGVDDGLVDGDIPYTIITSPAISSNPEFRGVDPEDVSVTNLDDEGGPVANDDTATTDEDQAATIDVLANDAALNLPPYILTVEPAPPNGAAAVNADNTITYTPKAGFFGEDTFGYQLCDPRLRCDTAVVNVTVNRVNRPPTAADDSYSIAQDTVLAGSPNADSPGVLDNDLDANDDPLSAILVAEPSNGTLSLEGDGSFTYTPDPGFVGMDLFNYQASDGASSSNVAKVAIEVKDTTPPLLEWSSPSDNRRVSQVGEEIIPLQVNVSDNIAVKQVRYFRWDPVGEQYVDIDTALSPPFQIMLDTDQLVPGWNQIFARAYDAAGNYSQAEFIWLFHTLRIYLPILYPSR